MTPESSLDALDGLPVDTGGDGAPLSVAYREGELIGDKYELRRMLGEGGMGVVWLAHNKALQADVAIKLLRAGERSVTLQRRMLKEAQVVARLGHPAILRVFDFGTTRLGDPYMVMEVLDGEDLARTLERNGRLSPIKAVRTLLPVLHALETAHQKGIIHRDLKPENIFLTTTDSGSVQPKVVDFGVVKTREPELVRLTHVDAVIGTPAYLSPEQARGEDVDHRIDIWSAAVVLYEMLTCRQPFDGSNYNALMRSIIEDAPRPLSNFGVDDAALCAIVERGLAKRVDARWSSMSAFGGALASWLLAQGETDDISGASLRAAWQQGAHAAHPDDLYSARPLRPAREAAPVVRKERRPAAWRRPWPRAVASALLLGFAGLYIEASSAQPAPSAPEAGSAEVVAPALPVRDEATPREGASANAATTAPVPAATATSTASTPAPVLEVAPARRQRHPVSTPSPRRPTRDSARSRATAPNTRTVETDDLKATL